jgi:hypothetical protein
MLAYACAVAAASPLANRYIDLIENAVTGSLHDEAGRCIMGGDHYTCSATTGEDGKPVFAAYNSTLRLLGRDWPPYGHTMVGHMRLRNIRATLQRVAKDKIEGAAAPERARARPLKADKPEHEQHTLSRCLNVMCGVSAA